MSHPPTRSSLSETELEFIRFVERHIGARAALYEADLDSGLPGDTVRMTMNTDMSGRHHTVEFMSLTAAGRWEVAGCIEHSLRETEAIRGRRIERESAFEVVGPDARTGQPDQTDVEPVVRAQLDKLKAARLLPLSSRRAA
jgi:hypothetical protein